MTLYRDILAQGWRLTWRSKYLWFFGLFAALLGNGGELEIIIRNFNSGFYSESLFPSLRGIVATGFFSWQTVENMGALLVNDPLTLLFILALFLAILFLAVFLLWLIMVAQAALVNNAAMHAAEKKHNFQDGLAVGRKKFWPVLGLNIIGKAVIYVLFLFVSVPALLSLGQTNFLPASLLFVISFLVFVPIAITVSFIVKYSIAYVVIKGNHLAEALKSGWQLFTANWLISLEMAFILFFINFAVAIAVVLCFLILAVPFLFLALLFAKAGMVINFWLVITSALLAYLAIIALVGSGLAVFQISSWTALYIKLVSRGGVSKLVRVFEKGK
ncbi:MAG: hypothetical protein MUC28_02955 [Planctomycetes bacterium]|jgi:hypothetical protein|nr:hypothetical protein [Planctomycetota bacterium]